MGICCWDSETLYTQSRPCSAAFLQCYFGLDARNAYPSLDLLFSRNLSILQQCSLHSGIYLHVYNSYMGVPPPPPKKKVKLSLHTSLVAHQARACPGFRSMKRLGVFLLVHHRVTPSSKFAGTHLYTWVERGTMRVKYLAQEHNAVPRPELEPGPPNPESSALTIRPPRFPQDDFE